MGLWDWITGKDDEDKDERREAREEREIQRDLVREERRERERREDRDWERDRAIEVRTPQPETVSERREAVQEKEIQREVVRVKEPTPKQEAIQEKELQRELVQEKETPSEKAERQRRATRFEDYDRAVRNKDREVEFSWWDVAKGVGGAMLAGSTLGVGTVLGAVLTEGAQTVRAQRKHGSHLYGKLRREGNQFLDAASTASDLVGTYDTIKQAPTKIAKAAWSDTTGETKGAFEKTVDKTIGSVESATQSVNNFTNRLTKGTVIKDRGYSFDKNMFIGAATTAILSNTEKDENGMAFSLTKKIGKAWNQGLTRIGRWTTGNPNYSSTAAQNIDPFSSSKFDGKGNYGKSRGKSNSWETNLDAGSQDLLRRSAKADLRIEESNKLVEGLMKTAFDPGTSEAARTAARQAANQQIAAMGSGLGSTLNSMVALAAADAQAKAELQAKEYEHKVLISTQAAIAKERDRVATTSQILKGASRSLGQKQEGTEWGLGAGKTLARMSEVDARTQLNRDADN